MYQSSGRRERSQIQDQIGRLTDPNYGRDTFQSMIQESVPSLNTFLGAQAANGGSERMAREQSQQATSEAIRQGMGQYGQMKLQAEQQAGGLMSTLLNDQRSRQQFREKMKFKRDQANSGIGDVFGSLAGSVAGSFLGPLGTKAGSKFGDSLFG